MDLRITLEQIVDHLTPRLDLYEQAIYLYLFRRSRLQGQEECVVALKSVRRIITMGIARYGRPMAECTCSRKTKSLAAKGCIEIIGTTRQGTRLRVFLPEEIPGVVPPPAPETLPTWEQTDFTGDAANRLKILQREDYRCFYCRQGIDSTNFVVEHVVSRPEGDNSYKNVVAACWSCNNRKGSTAADEFLRILYRGGFLSADEFGARIAALRRLKKGELKPAA